MMHASVWRRSLKRALMMHRGMLLVTLALSTLGLVMQYSASGGDITVLALPQALRLMVGLVLMVIRRHAPGAAVSCVLYHLFCLRRAPQFLPHVLNYTTSPAKTNSPMCFPY